MKVRLAILAIFVALPAYAQDASEPEQWREWLAAIVKDIGRSARAGNRDLLSRRIGRPADFLSAALALPAENDIRERCLLTAQSAVDYAASVREGNSRKARDELKVYQARDRECAAAITRPRSPVPDVNRANASDADVRSPREWLEEVRFDGNNAREAIARRNWAPLRAIADGAKAHRARIAAWKPKPARSEAYGICGDVVISLSRVASEPAAAIIEYDRLEPLCARAIGP
jgi:hypothetical protein